MLVARQCWRRQHALSTSLLVVFVRLLLAAVGTLINLSIISPRALWLPLLFRAGLGDSEVPGTVLDDARDRLRPQLGASSICWYGLAVAGRLLRMGKRQNKYISNPEMESKGVHLFDLGFIFL